MWFSHWLRNAGMLLSWAATTFPLLTACVIDVFITHLLSPHDVDGGWPISAEDQEGLVYWQEVCENWKQEENCWLLSFDKSRRRSELWLLRPTAGKDAMEVNSRGSSRFEGAAELRGVASVWTGTQLGLWLPHQIHVQLQRLNFSRMASKPPSKTNAWSQDMYDNRNPQAKDLLQD